MRKRSFLPAACLVLWLVGPALPVAVAQGQDLQAPAGDGLDDTTAKGREAQPAERTKTDLLMSLLRHLEQDRLKLAALDREFEEDQKFLDLLGQETFDIDNRLKESRLKLAELGPEADVEETAALGTLITKLETELQLYKNQVELGLTSEATVQEQKMVIQRMIALEERARARLRGAVSTEPDQPAEVSRVLEPTAPAVSPAPPLTMPGMPKITATSTPAPSEDLLETPDQIRARNELERVQIKLAVAEQAVVDFVEWRAAVERLSLLEDRLLQAARGSKENLEKGLRWRREELEKKTAAGAPRQEIRDLERGEKRLQTLIVEVSEEIDRRSEYLTGLNERLEISLSEEIRVTQVVDEMREKVKSAAEELYWLQSPLHPKNLLQWARTRGPRMLLVLAVAAVLLLLLRLTVRRAARLLVRKGRGESARGTNRADTLAFSFRSAFSVIVLIGGFLLVLQEAGLDIKTVLGGAAILGVAIAFGAQNLMRDYFTGFLILLEDQYELGDLISIGAVTGTVESVNMRVTVLRDLEGRVHFIPNGEIKGVTNRTYGWGRAVLEVPIGFDQDVDRAMEVLQGVSKDLKTDPVFGEWIKEDPVMLGVDKFTEFGVLIKFMLKTRPDKVFPIRRELLRRIKNTFDKEGIVISVPHLVVKQQIHDA